MERVDTALGFRFRGVERIRVAALHELRQAGPVALEQRQPLFESRSAACPGP